jgi:hypothetical protein
MKDSQKIARDLILFWAFVLTVVAIASTFPDTRDRCVKIGGAIAIAGKC